MPAFFYSTLDFLFSNLNPVSRIFKFADKYRSWLKSVKFIKISFVWHIAHEVINITFFFLFLFILFKDERLRPAEAIM